MRRSFRTAEVLALNELPHEGVCQPAPALYIVNSEPNFCVGAHWVAICIRRNMPAEFFDPLGLAPSVYSTRLVQLLKCNSMNGRYERSKICLQKEGSTLCGPYCLMYAATRGLHQASSISDICEGLRKMTELEVVMNLGTLLA